MPKKDPEVLKPSSVIGLKPTLTQSHVLSVLADYVALTKPPIILLLLITALGAMFLAAQGPPPVLVTWLLMLGGAAAAGGASAINHFLDRTLTGLCSGPGDGPCPESASHPPQP